MTAADKPRADLVALDVFAAFAKLPPGHASLVLYGDAAGDLLHAWATAQNLRVTMEPMYTRTCGRWTMLEVRVSGGTISVHLDSVQEQPAAEGSV